MELKFSTVRERDMDLLFLETIGSDKDFAKMIVNKTKWNGNKFAVCSIELSRTEADLGESDITVIIGIDDVRYAILLEDKIDAVAMPDQHKRYVERGRRGIEEGEYNDFDIIIICPQKYYNNNDEAKLYEHHIFYEECEEYFKSRTDDASKVRLLQIQAAINKAKKPPEVNLSNMRKCANCPAFWNASLKLVTPHHSTARSPIRLAVLVGKIKLSEPIVVHQL